jgi:hypothetical protein
MTPPATWTNVTVFKEVARGGVRTRVLSLSFIFSFFASLLLSHSVTVANFKLRSTAEQMPALFLP